ncbi:MAG: sigma-54-dependent Fis family transcriptional regulator [Deltaproteobacteria bacterium HGW-Deltaproteobacteria-6]|jgi:transcriptional regulator of acetoin/glycerol metabolism|nr:MAG: sigma-54-dependent Fis family transcriptional regulator [Deltaproteobacteria bacterium HGW-Deltaproteobacteria-6]
MKNNASNRNTSSDSEKGRLERKPFVSRREQQGPDYYDKFQATKKEWEKFITGNTDIDRQVITAEVFDSWVRCQKLGVDPIRIPHHEILAGSDLKKLLGYHASFIDISRPFMQNLHKFLAGSGFLVALYDKDGYVLEVIGDENAVNHARRGEFVVGSLWTEESSGNNNVGTVLRLKKPIQIFAAQHYHRFFHNETDSSAPIYDPEGKLIGGICLTGHYFRATPDTLGMVIAAASAIENEMQTRKAARELQVAYRFQKTVITSIPEALITIDNQGLISLINDNAKKLLFPDENNVVGQPVHKVFGKENHRFLSIIRDYETLTDAEIRIFTRSTGYDYTMTCNTISDADGKTIGKIIILNEIKRAKTMVTKMIGAKAKFSFEDVCGRSPRFLTTLEQARVVSQNSSNVLLLGESGTGKDVFAQAIHNAGDRKNGPYVAINCAAIPRDLITSELFGYSEGAYTGSRRGGNQGKFELADGGTIFLDEIAETPLELQAVLLRVIEDKSIVRIGGSRVRPVDVRIIAATNRDIMGEIRKGTFRKDLYYRLSVFSIHLLPLSERPDDIPLLVDNFVQKHAQYSKRKPCTVSPQVIDAFQQYNWPGNIRELQNVMERMLNFARSDELTADLIPEEIRPTSAGHRLEPIMTSREFERQAIQKMLSNKLKKAEIARKMGISRPTLYRKFREYNIS